MKHKVISKIFICLTAAMFLLTSLSGGLVSACPECEMLSFGDFCYTVVTDYDDDYNAYYYVSITGYSGNSEAVVIPDEIDGLPVTTIDYLAVGYNEEINSVTVPSSVTQISDKAFEGCTNLSEINLPSTLTFIGEDILAGTAYAKENFEDGLLYAGQYLLDSDILALPDNTSVKDGTTLIASFVFYNSNIQSVSLPSSLKIINDYAFYNCESLTAVNIPEGVTDIENSAFYNCTALEAVSLPSTLETIGINCFSGCESLTSLDVPESITELPSGMLSGCKSITTFEIKDTVSYVDSAFSYSGLKSIHIPASVVMMSALAFADCSELASITVDSNNKWYFAEDNVLFEKSFINGSIELIRIPCDESFDSYVVPEDVVTISFDALSGNSTLKHLTLGSKVKIFWPDDSPGLESISVHPDNAVFSAVDDLLLTDGGTTAVFYPTGKTDSHYTVPSQVTKIDNECFLNNPYLKELTIPDTVQELDMGAVTSCDNLTTINMSPCDAHYWSIQSCDNMTRINFSGSVAEWRDMGLECYNNENEAGLYAICTNGIVELEAPEWDYELGDCNMDDELNVKDVTAIQKHLAGISTLSEEGCVYADSSLDGELNIKDATFIQKLLAGIYTIFYF